MDMKIIFRKTGTMVAAALSIALLGASAASAATFDFVAMADNGPAPATRDVNYIGPNEGNWQVFFAGGLTIDGITLDASGSNTTSAAADALADAFFDKGNAGLGVCSSVSCSTQDAKANVLGTDPSDDNVTNGEVLTLNFNQLVNITSITFYEKHNKLLTGSLGLNGGTLMFDNNGVLTSGAELLAGASIFNFSYTTDEFYIATATAVSAVPLPAGMVLLLTGFGALGVARRRKTAAAA
jgi:hypothetical protein